MRRAAAKWPSSAWAPIPRATPAETSSRRGADRELPGGLAARCPQRDRDPSYDPCQPGARQCPHRCPFWRRRSRRAPRANMARLGRAAPADDGLRSSPRPNRRTPSTIVPMHVGEPTAMPSHHARSSAVASATLRRRTSASGRLAQPPPRPGRPSGACCRCRCGRGRARERTVAWSVPWPPMTPRARWRRSTTPCSVIARSQTDWAHPHRARPVAHALC
jgi:hypothetical protein